MNSVSLSEYRKFRPPFDRAKRKERRANGHGKGIWVQTDLIPSEFGVLVTSFLQTVQTLSSWENILQMMYSPLCLLLYTLPCFSFLCIKLHIGISIMVIPWKFMFNHSDSHYTNFTFGRITLGNIDVAIICVSDTHFVFICLGLTWTPAFLPIWGAMFAAISCSWHKCSWYSVRPHQRTVYSL